MSSSSGFVVLSDVAVHDVLMNLTKDDIVLFLEAIGATLRAFSLGGERAYQPDPAIVNRPDGRRNLFRLFTSSAGVGVKIIVDPSQANKLMGLHGLIALCDKNGFPAGIINAEEVTGFRTALSAMVLYIRRRATANVVIFGAGKQALWHTRLILGLRGDEIKRITFVNRSAERTRLLIEQIKRENEARWKAAVQFDSVPPPTAAEALEDVLQQADAVFCTTPSKQVLFPARFLGSPVAKSCYVSAIGSWQADMIELDPALLTDASERGIVIVDDRKECAATGEIIHVGVGMTDLASAHAILALAKKKGHGFTVPEF
ncbi:hypothetical protein DV738_g2897, partial [Chaetothyriales sp. CBS 135597]